MNKRPLTVLSVILVVFAFLTPGWAMGTEASPLFRIERSKNKNIVQYDARLLRNNTISESNPVHAYWVLADGQKEELGMLERREAYGIESAEKLSRNKFRIVLAALGSRSLIVQKMKEGYKALIRIGGELSILDRVYVQSEEGILGLPKVQYVDLFGRSIKTDKLVHERIIPS